MYTAMTNAEATRRSSKSRAGVTNTGPRIASRSSHPRTRAVTRGRPLGARISSALTAAILSGEDLLHLGLGPGNRVLGRGTGHGLGEHAGQKIRVGDELHFVRGRRWPAVGVVLHTLASEGSILGVGPEHRMVLDFFVRRQIEGVPGHDVLVVDLALPEQVADPLL